MTVDEKGLADEIEREMMTWRGANGGVYTIRACAFAIAQRMASRLLSARSAEPVASDITEEEIARALVEFQFPGCGEDEATVASHLPMARAVLAIVHPALERARVEERERCLAIVNAQTPDWVKERSGPYWDGYREAMEDASDDIRKAP